jgi:hypothetical protein
MSDKVFNQVMVLLWLVGLLVVALDLWVWRP